MPVYSANAIAFVAQNVGFSTTKQVRGVSEVVMATAIALAESGGDSEAHNTTPPDNSYGWWQINMYGDLGPARRQSIGISNNEELFKPGINGRAAKMIYDQQGWSAWSVYTNGLYARQLGKAKRGAANPKPGKLGEVDGATESNVDLNKLNPFEPFGKFIEENAFRVGLFVGGLVIIFVGILLYAKESGALNQVIKAIPAGKAVKKVMK